MSYTWFKLHHDLPDDIKLRKFTPQEKWAWVALLCLASKATPERGVVDAEDADIADYCEFNSTQDWLYYRDKLISKGMLEISPFGKLLILHWEDRQYQKPSDTPNAVKSRVKKHRERKKQSSETPCNALQVECNANETPQTRLDADKDLEKESLKISSVVSRIGDSGESPSASEAAFLESGNEGFVQSVDEMPSNLDVIQGELVATEPNAVEGIGAGAKKTKTKRKTKASELASSFEDFQAAYNELKPALWASMEVITPARVNAFQRLVNDSGSRDKALECMKTGLLFAQQDEWCRTRSLSFDEAQSNGKFFKWHEKWLGIQRRGGVSISQRDAESMSLKFEYLKALGA